MKKLLICLVLIVFAQLVKVNVFAQSSAIRISPLKNMFTAQPGETIKSTITLENTTNKPIQVRVTARDFEASDKLNGEPKLLDSPNPNFGLANWLTDANLQKVISIPANQKIDYQATLRVPQSAQVRTYFGSILFTETSGNESNFSVGSLVFVTIGKPATLLEITDFSYASSNDANQPYGIFNTTLSNQSMGLSNPEFTIKITDHSGNIIETINAKDRGNVLPKSSRIYSLAPTKTIGNQPLSATLSVVDQNGITADKTIQFGSEATASPSGEKVDDLLPNPRPIWQYVVAATLLIVIASSATYFIYKKRRKLPEVGPRETEDTPNINQDTLI